MTDFGRLSHQQWTERQQGLEDKRRLVEGMRSGRIPVYAEPELPSTRTTPNMPIPRDDNDGKQDDFEPCTFFFYGSLMDPQVLMAVAKLDNQPDLQDVWVEGFEMKMWGGMYPVLLPTKTTDNNSGASHRIKGKAWRATTMDQCLRLHRYETSAYEAADCRLYHSGGGEPTKGLVFVWARDPASDQLAEGAFDLEHWQKTYKPSRFPV
ncbi:hypothetical protein C8A01DRAFT_46297 [Parachaetomium inaequale]|uniref:Putative gamma-glutamylcyclotransferase n=1 Tax=Parachaetomium inaequale TaxID=2588326 RepID=A0AAN6SSE8_9PEZI|nr:hypothetical protein C8A01DRAFT_46297 [Parachaetomium inaequale]